MDGDRGSEPPARTADRILELNGITDWLETLGIPARGGATGSIAATKDQFMRLAFSTFTMVLRGPNSEELFKRESLIESGIFGGDDLTLYRAGQYRKWPGHRSWPQPTTPTSVSLMTPSRSRPCDSEVANNAMAIDILVYLSYRLPTLSRDDTAILTWRDLMAQFGSGSAGEFASKFKDTFVNRSEGRLRPIRKRASRSRPRASSCAIPIRSIAARVRGAAG